MKIVYLLLTVLLLSCHSTKNSIVIKQTQVTEDSLINIIEGKISKNREIRIPVSFIIQNQTNKEIYFKKYRYKYGLTKGASLVIEQRSKNGDRIVKGRSMKNVIPPLSSEKYFFSTRHFVKNNSELNKKFQNIIKKTGGLKPMYSKYQFKEKFDEILSKFENDSLEIIFYFEKDNPKKIRKIISIEH